MQPKVILQLYPMQDAFDAVLDHKTVVPKGGTVMVFKLEKE